MELQLGTTQSNIKEVRAIKLGSVVEAGKAVYVNSVLEGISLGEHPSQAGYTAVCIRGERIPLLIKSGEESNIADRAVVKIEAVNGTSDETAGTASLAKYHGDAKFDAIKEDGTAHTLKACLVDAIGGF